MSKVLSVLALFTLTACGAEVARVDLANAKKTPEPERDTTFHSRGGGVLGHGRSVRPDTPTITVRLTRITMSKDNRFGNTLEVVVTNTGPVPVALPIGTDPVLLLAPSQHDRRYLTFTIMSVDGAHRGGSAESASNSEHPETSALLQPGDTAVFILPFFPGPRVREAARAGDSPQYRVSLWLGRKTMDKGADWSEPLGAQVPSENTLPLP